MRFLLVSIIVAILATVLKGRVLQHSSQPLGFSDETDISYLLPLTPVVTAGLDFDINKVADDAMWNQYVSKGYHMNCIMDATDAGAGYLLEDTRKPPSAASVWSGSLKSELEKWGWHDSDYDRGWECDFERMRLGAAFQGLGLNAKPRYDDDGEPADGDNDCFSITHYNKENYADPQAEWPQMMPLLKQKYIVDGKEYTATGGFFEFAINAKGGAIIGKNLESPSMAIIDRNSWGRKAAPDELPGLRFCSDIYWAYWFNNNPDIKNLRVYGAYNIVNDATVLLAARVMKGAQQKKLSPWPGSSFDADSEEGKALVGSPIGATMAILLAQHKAELGIKHITKVTIVTNDALAKPRFGERPKNDLNIFFHIADVPADQIKDAKSEDENHGYELSRLVNRASILHVRDSGKHILRVHTFSI